MNQCDTDLVTLQRRLYCIIDTFQIINYYDHCPVPRGK